MEKWYYSKNGKSEGPVSGEILRQMVQAGQVLASDLVWKTGMSGWETANAALSLGHPNPPPLPAAAMPLPPQQQYAAAQSFAAPYRKFGEAISVCFSKYATFKGRASRSEYWWFALFNWLLSFGVMFIFGFMSGATKEPSYLMTGNAISMLCSLALLLPNLAVAVRRLHDTGRSGWWIGSVWIVIAVLVLVGVASGGSDVIMSLVVLVFIGLLGLGITVFVFSVLKGHPERNQYQD